MQLLFTNLNILTYQPRTWRVSGPPQPRALLLRFRTLARFPPLSASPA